MLSRNARRILCLLPAAGIMLGCSSDDTADPGGAGSGGTSGSGGSTAGAGGSGAIGGSGAGGSGGSASEQPAPVPNGCITDVTPGVQSLDCEGLSFLLSVPEACLSEACGLIADVHGFGMTAEVMNQQTHMQELAGAKGYIVIQPTAPGMPPAWSETNDAQVLAIMQHVAEAWHVDEKRVHIDGYSMGGWMTWRFICKYSDIIASAAPMAAGAGAGVCDFSEGNRPSRQLPIFYTHGRTDGLVAFSGAETIVPQVTGAWYAGITPDVVAEAADYRWERWTNADGNVFEFLQHDWRIAPGGAEALAGHCFPGVEAGLGCGADNAVVWSETVLQFFIDHPME